jgi:hypothetical protein
VPKFLRAIKKQAEEKERLEQNQKVALERIGYLSSEKEFFKEMVQGISPNPHESRILVSGSHLGLAFARGDGLEFVQHHGSLLGGRNGRIRHP